jgi:hypothetical protein
MKALLDLMFVNMDGSIKKSLLACRPDQTEYPFAGYLGSREDMQKVEGIFRSLAKEGISWKEFKSLKHRETYKMIVQLAQPEHVRLDIQVRSDNSQDLVDIVQLFPKTSEMFVDIEYDSGFSINDCMRTVFSILRASKGLSRFEFSPSVHSFTSLAEDEIFEILSGIETLETICFIGSIRPKNAVAICKMLEGCKNLQSIEMHIQCDYKTCAEISHKISKSKSIKMVNVAFYDYKMNYDLSASMLLSETIEEIEKFVYCARKPASFYAKSSKLKKLNLRLETAPIDDLSVFKEWIVSMDSLKRLKVSLGSRQDENLANSMLDCISGIRSLEKLCVCVPISNESLDSVFRLLENSPGMESLTLNFSLISTEKKMKLADMFRLVPKLRHLYVEFDKYQKEIMIEFLKTMSVFTKLETLYLSPKKFTTYTASLLRDSVKSIGSLKKFKISEVIAKNAAIEIIADIIPRLPLLETFYFHTDSMQKKRSIFLLAESVLVYKKHELQKIETIDYDYLEVLTERARLRQMCWLYSESIHNNNSFLYGMPKSFFVSVTVKHFNMFRNEDISRVFGDFFFGFYTKNSNS